MINYTDKQKRYVLKPTVPSDTVYISYYIYWGDSDNLIYSGKARHFGDFEIDLTSWVEWVWNRYSVNGVMTYYGDLIVDFVFIDEDGNEHMTSSDRYYMPVVKDETTLTYQPSLAGLIDIDAPMNEQKKPILTPGSSAVPVDSFGVWVYPVFYVERKSDGKKGKIDCSGFAGSYAETGRTLNAAEFWTDDCIDDPDTIDFLYDVFNKVLDHYDAEEAFDNAMLDEYFKPHINYEGGTVEYFSTDGWDYTPINYFWDMEDYNTGEGHYSYILSQPYTIRKNESEFLAFWKNKIPSTVSSLYDVVGYGYSVIYVYPQYLRVSGDNQNPMRFDYHCVGGPKEDGCPYFNLLLVNSDFTGDINVPLAVVNGSLRGKSVNNLDKVTYMDRYGDTHNGTISNTYELDCYVDADWLQTTTGNDLGYEEVMLAMQSARRSLLIGNARISGMRTSDFTMLECRVKDVETVETWSRYNGTNRVPSLKITIEIRK